ncbi:DUF438 domain-containing protein [Alkaliphilus peptidifermentans]|uniref:PAC domain-containing protein n=1 Tax=Alkaliphilus peptidifermentans DSM 18978 TaxID=1120976 RepID=A0A1G5ID51_9FIRM|nr:DUF438 domain-containing protein [Alkaliphilus peptidifermentans]SCY73933.1 hypothetical protein SAMN03080606_02350 [Alkaliphilus peptidifermentans DSM 18978]
MSELINNREERKKILKELITELHEGKSVDDVKTRFNQLIDNIGATEIAEMEQALITEGVPVSEVKRLCDVHVTVFKESLDKAPTSDTVPGHPIYTFRQENRAIEKVIDLIILPALDTLKAKSKNIKEELLKFREGFNQLSDIEKHYSRKENLLFPYLEKYEFTGPTSVMWGIDDDIRGMLKEGILLTKGLQDDNGDVSDLVTKTEELVEAIQSMIYKEENILFPTALELLSVDEWGYILSESSEIGYCLIEPENQWKPSEIEDKAKDELNESKTTQGYLKFDTGILKLEEISAIFNHLPLDITFVDKDNIVKYFSEGKERIFTRTKAIVGRKVENCHPPSSVHVVEKIVSDFQSGKKDHVDFWIQMQGMFIYIQYFAVRDKEGSFMGTLEVTQNIAGIKKLEGEKRLMEE